MSTGRAHILGEKWRSDDVKLRENADFSSLLLKERVLTGLKKAGFKHPSPIQLEAIPVGRFGKDMIVQAKSGTGKTLVFSVIALEVIVEQLKHPQVLILAPTREIAFQICDVIKALSSGFKELKCCTFIGGLPVADDMEAVIGCQIAVGTPGRIKQLVESKVLLGGYMRLLVLDEADQLLDKSFKSDIDIIINFMRKERQVIATSATYPKKLKNLVERFFREPYVARLNQDHLSLLGMIHYTNTVTNSQMPVLAYRLRLQALECILSTVKFSQCLVFCNLISRVETLCRDIRKWGFSAAYISSAKEQGARLKAIDNLKRFKCKVLVSSDLSSRGIDAENVDLIINFDSPSMSEVYLHRVGRAGRYGSKGVAITLLTDKDIDAFKKIEKEGNFRAFILPVPVPKNLINLRPERIPSSGDEACSGSEESTCGTDDDIPESVLDNLKYDYSRCNGNSKPLLEGVNDGKNLPEETQNNFCDKNDADDPSLEAAELSSSDVIVEVVNGISNMESDIGDSSEQEEMANFSKESHSLSEMGVTSLHVCDDAPEVDTTSEPLKHLSVKENGEPAQREPQINEHQFLTKRLIENDCEGIELAPEKEDKSSCVDSEISSTDSSQNCVSKESIGIGEKVESLETPSEHKPKKNLPPNFGARPKVFDSIAQESAQGKTEAQLKGNLRNISADLELTLPVMNILKLCEENKNISVSDQKKEFKDDLLFQISKLSSYPEAGNDLLDYYSAACKDYAQWYLEYNKIDQSVENFQLGLELAQRKEPSSNCAASPESPSCLNRSENDSVMNSGELRQETQQDCVDSENVQHDISEKETEDKFINCFRSACGLESTPLKKSDTIKVRNSSSASSGSESECSNPMLVLEKEFSKMRNKTKKSPASVMPGKLKKSLRPIKSLKAVSFSEQTPPNNQSRRNVRDESTDEFGGACAAKSSIKRSDYLKPHRGMGDTSSSSSEVVIDSHEQPHRIQKKHWLLTSPRTRQKSHRLEEGPVFYPEKKKAQSSSRKLSKSEGRKILIDSNLSTCAQASDTSSSSDTSANDSHKKSRHIPKKHWLLTSPRARQNSHQLEEGSVFYPEKEKAQSTSKKLPKGETKAGSSPIYSHEPTCPLAAFRANQSNCHQRMGEHNRPSDSYRSAYSQVDQSSCIHRCSKYPCMQPSTHPCHSADNYNAPCTSQVCRNWHEIFIQQWKFISQASRFQ